MFVDRKYWLFNKTNQLCLFGLGVLVLASIVVVVVMIVLPVMMVVMTMMPM